MERSLSRGGLKYVLIIALLGVFSLSLSSEIRAQTNRLDYHKPLLQPVGELSYFRVYRAYPRWQYGPRSYVYPGPGYYRPGYVWTPWRSYYFRYGINCSRSCLINKRNGKIFRCIKRCR